MRWRLIVPIAVVLAAGSGVAGFLLLRHQVHGGTARSIGPAGGTVSAYGVTVAVPRGALARWAAVSINRVAPSGADKLLPGTVDSSPTFHITVGGRLARPVELRLPVARHTGTGTLVVAASREGPRKMWTLVRGRFDARRSELTLKTQSLSFWKDIKNAVKKLKGKALQAALNGGAALTSKFLQLGDTRASEPTCSQPPAGYLLSGDVGIGDSNALIFACLDQHGSDMALRVVNNRAIGMRFDLPDGLRVDSSSTLSGSLLDQVESAFASSSDRARVIPAVGDVTLTGQPHETDLIVRPTLGAFLFDLNVFMVNQTVGKVADAADYLGCVGQSAAPLVSTQGSSARDAFDAAVRVWGECGQRLLKAGAVIGAPEAAAAFFGGMKLGVGSTDAIAALINREEASLRVRRSTPTTPTPTPKPEEPAANGPCGTVHVTTPKYGFRFSAAVTVEGFLSGPGPTCEEAREVVSNRLLGKDTEPRRAPGTIWKCKGTPVGTGEIVICRIPGESGHIMGEVAQDS